MPKKESKLFVVTVQWSQTEQEHYVIQADSKQDAEQIIKENCSGYRWISGTSEAFDWTHKKVIKKRRVLPK